MENKTDKNGWITAPNKEIEQQKKVKIILTNGFLTAIRRAFKT